MNRLQKTILLFLLIGVASAGEPIRGKVVSIADGDTLTVLDAEHTQYKIRLLGIDAPEKSQPFGQRSKASLGSLVFQQQVTVEWSKLDRYGRTVGKVISADGTDANLEQIKRGMAWHYKQYEKEQPSRDRLTYAQAEENAKRLDIGLWQDRRPISPWDYRHDSRKRQ